MAPSIALHGQYGSKSDNDFQSSPKDGQPQLIERPKRLDATLAWSASQFEHEDRYIHQLSQDNKDEISAALSFAKGACQSANDINRQTFPLPHLSSQLRSMAQDIHKGKGFVVIRGLSPTDFSQEDNALIFLGLSSYIGEHRGKQTCEGDILMHIKNAPTMNAPQKDRPARDSNLALSFHSDLWTDIVALQTLGCAAIGGDHVIAPAYTIFNDMALTRPDLLDALMRPQWQFDEHSLHHTPDRRPLIAYKSGRILFNFGRLHIFGDGSCIKPTELTSQQVESVEYLQDLAHKHKIKLPLRPGDLCFINNFAILHAREAFVDTLESTRHLIRLWLKNESLAWSLPPHLQRGNEKVFSSIEGEERWELVPIPRLNFKIRDKFSP